MDDEVMRVDGLLKRGFVSLLAGRCLRTASLRFERVLVPGLLFLVFLGVCCGLAGCGDQVRAPFPEQIADFERAGPPGPALDLERLVRARISPGPYRVVPGDVLELEMPRVLDSQLLEAPPPAGGRESFRFRIASDGTILLPVIGPFPVAGRSLTEIESAVMAQYYPKYIKTRLPIYVSVLEYRTYRVSVVGAVARMGIYNLRHDQMSLVALLMEAGGIVDDGAAVIRIVRQDPQSDWSAGGNEIAVPPAPTEQLLRSGVQISTLAPGAGDGCAVLREDGVTRVVFQPEGPLLTTGRLLVEERGVVRFEEWLDLGSYVQRRAVLKRAGAVLTPDMTAELKASLPRMANALESGASRFGVRRAQWDPGSQRAGVRAFETFVQHTATQESAPESPGSDTTVVLPVRGLNVPAVDVALRPGDSVIVERPAVQNLVVLGLVARPGSFPYPPDTQYNVAQALGLAGGLDPIAEPRYVSIYRLTAEGAVASVTLQLVNPGRQEQLTEALALALKPGDVLSVEHTPRTRTNVFFDRIFRISLGLYMTPEDFLDDDDG